MTATPDAQSVVLFLEDHPHFFDEYPELMLQLKLTTPLGGRTVSLQDRQAEVLREKVKQLELKLGNLTRIVSSNNLITEKLHRWMRSLLLSREDQNFPDLMLHAMREAFDMPDVSLRIWNGSEKFAGAWFVDNHADNAREFADQLTQPYCGPVKNQPGLQWLDNAHAMQSVALLPLRRSDMPQSFGLLVLGSPDPQRFATDMATDYLARIGETASAALQGLLD
jgi:uncharacterized protein YigA (DUF484 family)